MPVSFLLLPVLQNHGDAHHEDGVNPHNTKGSRKDLVQVTVGEAGELRNTTTLLRRDQGVETSAVLNERRRG
jgi:hypothetical protein